jgi:hypothetical protein
VIAAYDMMQLPVPTAEVWAPYVAAEAAFAIEEAKMCKEYELAEQARYHEQRDAADGGASSATSNSDAEGLSEAELLEVAALVTPGFGDVDSDFADDDAAATISSAVSTSTDSSARSAPPVVAAAAVLSDELAPAVAVAVVSIDSAVIGSTVDGDTGVTTASDSELDAEDEIDEAEFQRRWYGVA